MTYEVNPRPRARMMDTQATAYESAVRNMTKSKREVMQVYRDHPDGLTADECADKMNRHLLAVRPTVCILQKEGYLRDSGQRRPNAVSGKPAAVWVLAV